MWASLRAHQSKIQKFKQHSVFLFTYSQEDNRHQRQKRQHGFWLLKGLLKDRCRRPDRGRPRKSPNPGGSVSGRRRKGKKGYRDRVEGCRMPGQKAAGQQQKTHCPLVYTQPHPLPRPGPSPFLLSARPPVPPPPPPPHRHSLCCTSPNLPLLKQTAHICV